MSLGRQKKTFLFSPKLGHSYSAIALRWLLAKNNKSAPPKRKRGEIFALLNFMCRRFVVKVINLIRERRNGVRLCCGDYSYFFSLLFVVPLVYFSTFFFSLFCCCCWEEKLDFFSSFSPLVSLSLFHADTNTRRRQKIYHTHAQA
jgi:hypothetical protein